MKKTKSISIIILLAVLAGCVGGSKQPSDTFITVDVNASYPEKELVLQDIMDVEYIALETTDEFITKGIVKAIGEDILLVTNQNDGDIFVFDRNGKALRKINHFGQGGEEYSQVSDIILDEDNNEMFVKDFHARKMLVYDLYGNFKRSLQFTDMGTDPNYYVYTFNYDKDNLISFNYKGYGTLSKEKSYHLIISKQDGSIVREIQVPFDKIKTPDIIQEDLYVALVFRPTIPCYGNWLLMNPSSDTIYTCLPGANIIPLIVRTPSIQAMDPEIFLFPSVFTDRYYFMQTVKKEFDFEKMKVPATDLVYDKHENAIFKYTLYNDDFSDKKQVLLNLTPVNHEIAICHSLQAHNLVEAYEKGQLKGKLKEIAAELDEESNPVLMLVKHKQ